LDGLGHLGLARLGGESSNRTFFVPSVGEKPLFRGSKPLPRTFTHELGLVHRPATIIDAGGPRYRAIEEPKLVAEITYLTWTGDGLLRHTVYVGLREDKPADQVRRER